MGINIEPPFKGSGGGLTLPSTGKLLATFTAVETVIAQISIGVPKVGNAYSLRALMALVSSATIDKFAVRLGATGTTADLLLGAVSGTGSTMNAVEGQLQVVAAGPTGNITGALHQYSDTQNNLALFATGVNLSTLPLLLSFTGQITSGTGTVNLQSIALEQYA